jgi:hypothetical protein
MRQLRGVMAAFFVLFAVSAGPAGAQEDAVPTRYALGGSLGLSYDPNNDVDFVLLSGAALLDYDRVWPHRAPEPLRFKVEGSAGLTTAPRTRAVVSANILALYFLQRWETPTVRPYAEAGIGLIYTDFQVDGQGLRVNFNPQAGVGAELDLGIAGQWFVAVRAHHVSNGDLYKDNRGINSVVMQLGFFLR